MQDRVVLVAGASRGLGRAVALAAARLKAVVVATAKSEAGLLALDDRVRQEGLPALILAPANFLRPSELDRLGGALFERFGRLDALLLASSMAGTASPIAASDPKNWEDVVKVNLLGTQRLIRSLEPLLLASPAGRAVIASDPVGRQAPPYRAPYSVTKAAVESLALTWAAEHARHPRLRITVASLPPMATDTRFAAFPGAPAASLAAPESVAERILPLLAAESTLHGAVSLEG